MYTQSPSTDHRADHPLSDQSRGTVAWVYSTLGLLPGPIAELRIYSVCVCSLSVGLIVAIWGLCTCRFVSLCLCFSFHALLGTTFIHKNGRSHAWNPFSLWQHSLRGRSTRGNLGLRPMWDICCFLDIWTVWQPKLLKVAQLVLWIVWISMHQNYYYYEV